MVPDTTTFTCRVKDEQLYVPDKFKDESPEERELVSQEVPLAMSSASLTPLYILQFNVGLYGAILSPRADAQEMDHVVAERKAAEEAERNVQLIQKIARLFRLSVD